MEKERLTETESEGEVRAVQAEINARGLNLVTAIGSWQHQPECGAGPALCTLKLSVCRYHSHLYVPWFVRTGSN